MKIHELYDITGYGIFKAGLQNWKGFCIKINCSQMKLLNFENWTNGEPQSLAKIVDFYTKTFPILYPCLENSTTSNAILVNIQSFILNEIRKRYISFHLLWKPKDLILNWSFLFWLIEFYLSETGYRKPNLTAICFRLLILLN